MLENCALSGLKVVEYAHFISGPYCAKLLAALGLGQRPLELTGIAQSLWIHLATGLSKKAGSVVSTETRQYTQHQTEGL